MLIERIHDKGTLAGPGYTRHAGKHSQRETHVHALEVVGGHIVQDDFTARLAPLFRHGYTHVARQVAGRQRAGPEKSRHIALVHDFAALDAGTRTELNDRVRSAYGRVVVLHHKHRVAPGLERAQRGDELLVVTRMQTDGGLVEHVGHAHEAGTELGSQPDALCLTAGERGHAPRKGQVTEPHVNKEREPVQQFLHERLRNNGPPSLKGTALQPLQLPVYGKGTEIGDAQAVNAHRERFPGKTLPVTGRAGRGLHVTAELITPGVAVLHAFFKKRNDAGPAVFRDFQIDLGLQALCEVLVLVVAFGVHGHAAAHPVAPESCGGVGGLVLPVLSVKEREPGPGAEILERR